MLISICNAGQRFGGKTSNPVYLKCLTPDLVVSQHVSMVIFEHIDTVGLLLSMRPVSKLLNNSPEY